MIDPTALVLRSATNDDFEYVYRLCETTMRSYVEADLGNCFECIAPPAIQKLIKAGLFSKIYANGALVGAVAYEVQAAHIQLEELYIESKRQNEGLGTEVMKRLMGKSRLLALPIRLHVLVSNPALSFYEKFGFTVTRSTPQVNYMECVARSAGNEARFA